MRTTHLSGRSRGIDRFGSEVAEDKHGILVDDRRCVLDKRHEPPDPVVRSQQCAKGGGVLTKAAVYQQCELYDGRGLV